MLGCGAVDCGIARLLFFSEKCGAETEKELGVF